MEFILEVLLDLILEGSVEISSNHKISKFIRYPLIVLIIAFFLGIISLILIVGLVSLKEHPLLGLFLIIVSIILLIGSIIKFKNTYIKKTHHENLHLK